MVTTPTGFDRTTGEEIEKSKTFTTIEHGDADVHTTGRSRTMPRPRADLSGFIGADVWMVGKYER